MHTPIPKWFVVVFAVLFSLCFFASLLWEPETVPAALIAGITGTAILYILRLRALLEIAQTERDEIAQDYRNQFHQDHPLSP